MPLRDVYKRQLYADSCVYRIYFCGSDLLPGSGSGTNRRASDPVAVSYTHLFGRMFHDKNKKAQAEKKGTRPIFGRQAGPVFGAMAILFLVGLMICFFAEKAGNPVLEQAGLSQAMGNMRCV